MKHIIFYHRSDLDGHCSGAIARNALEKQGHEVEMIGIEYGDEFPWDKVKGAHVVMVDFSLQPWEDMVRLAKEAGRLLWIDHHKSAIEANREHPMPVDKLSNVSVVLLEGRAACELAWAFFNPNIVMPTAVRLLGRYDVWDLEAEEDVLPFQMGMRLGDWDPSNDGAMAEWETIFDGAYSDDDFDEVVRRGKTVLEYQGECNARLMSKAFEHEWKGHTFLAVNAGGINSQAFESRYDPEKHYAVMSFFYTGELWTFSLYSPDQSKDLSGLAVEMGGGGHPCACGFQVKDLPEVGIMS